MADLIDTDERSDADEKAKPDQSKLDGFLRAFDTAAMPQQMQRAGSLQARRFASIPGAQWEGEWEDFSANMIRVEVNKTARGLEKITNDYRANRVTVNFRPVGDDDEATAETLDGMFRADAYRSNAGQSFDNGFDEGASGGLGGWRLANRYEDPNDPDNDHQVIDFLPIVDADQSAYFDPNSKNYDKSDAKWGCLIIAVARQAAIDEFGADRLFDWPKGAWKPFYEWFTPDVVRIAEWYQVEEKTETRITLTNRLTGEEVKVWESDVEADWLADQKAAGWSRSNKSVKRKRVHKYILSGAEILEDCGLIAGSEIPIILFYGKRWFIDNQERFRGHVQLAMDPQRIYNSQVSRLVETAGTSPIKRPYFFPEQVEGHSDELAERSIGRKAYNLINPLYDQDGNLASVQGPIAYDEPPEVDQVAAALLQLTGADIAELTSADDGADEAKANVSHEAMDLAATRTDEKSSGYMDNFRLSMEWCGKVYLGMAREIYVEEGRKVQTLSADGEHSEATLMQPETDDQGRFRIINDFSQGRFNVIADVTESSATKRDKTVRKALGVAQIAGSNGSTDIANAALITAVLNFDGDGMDDFKAYARKAALQIGLVKPTDQEQQEMQQAGQQQQPDPAQIVLMAQAKKFTSEAGKADAAAQAEQADAVLKIAQAHALGGPEKAPSGLQPAPQLDPAKAVDQVASAKLKSAQADKITHDIGLAHGEHQIQRIKTGHQIAMEQAAHELAVRQQDHAESQPANDRAAA